jgi:hypothetical protein
MDRGRIVQRWLHPAFSGHYSAPVHSARCLTNTQTTSPGAPSGDATSAWRRTPARATPHHSVAVAARCILATTPRHRASTHTSAGSVETATTATRDSSVAVEELSSAPKRSSMFATMKPMSQINNITCTDFSSFIYCYSRSTRFYDCPSLIACTAAAAPPHSMRHGAVLWPPSHSSVGRTCTRIDSDPVKLFRDVSPYQASSARAN